VSPEVTRRAYKELREHALSWLGRSSGGVGEELVRSSGGA